MKTNLNLPLFDIPVRTQEGKLFVFDPVRKKYVRLTPEEWVRQNFLLFLNEFKKYPISLMQVEKEFVWNNLSMRSDILLFSSDGKPRMIVECKAPEVAVTDKVFEQIARYNLRYQVPYLVVTNGLSHYCCKMNYNVGTYLFLEDIPDYKTISETGFIS